MFVKNGGSKSAIVAILLDMFVGGLGIHRIYLGTATMTWVGYILTCGGCGILPTIDFWVMVFNYNNIDKFVDNDKFFMW
jgi:TM2 domain-containing membrane protein YozV